MKKMFLIFVIVPFFVFAQDVKDTSANKIVISEDIMECVNDISENPDAIKYLLQTLVNDKEQLKQLHKELMKDPAMKEVIKELRNTVREDRGILDKKKSEEIDVNKEERDYTELRNTPERK